jgi:hypothetical protein
MNFFKNNYQIKSNFFKKAFIVFFIILIVTIPAFVFAQVTINPNLPGAVVPNTNNNPCTSIINFYWFAIFISGILAFGAIVYGGIKYQLAAGNPSGESEGKKWITGALEGLLLLFSAYLILKIINPNLTKCQLPELSFVEKHTINFQSTTVAPVGLKCNNGISATNGTSFTDECYPITSVGCKPPSEQPNRSLSCSASIPMNAVLSCMAQKLGSNYFIVTEAMPPTVVHKSHCHIDGCCVDTKLNVEVTQSNLYNLINIAKSCGAGEVLNEYAGFHGKTYITTTGDNVHIQASGCK